MLQVEGDEERNLERHLDIFEFGHAHERGANFNGTHQVNSAATYFQRRLSSPPLQLVQQIRTFVGLP